jgi:hypothetical protein
MKKAVNFILAAIILSSCSAPIAPTPNIPEIADNDEPKVSYSIAPPDFFSEEEFIEYLLNIQSNVRDEGYEYDEFGLVALTHYYKLATLPPEAIFYRITPVHGVSVVHHIQAEESRERIMIRYSSYYSFDIEEDGLWTERPFPEESHIIEHEGLTYYIRKVMGRDIPHWSVEWYNNDRYYMHSEFPYRFTPEEVLGYISDLERVEIG